MRLVFFALFSIVTISGCLSLGNREKADNQPDINETNALKIIGMVQVYGSEPHTFVGIVDQDKTEYAVYPASCEEELKKLQGHLIEFTVVFLDEPQGYGSLFLKGGTVTPVEWEIIQ